MTENLHIRAQKFFAQSLVEGLAPADQSWLEHHLSECADCAGEIESTRDLLQALRNVPVSVPRDLAARTQLRMRLRAQESVQPSQGSFLLWLITGLSWFVGVLSAPLVWRGFAWVGSYFHVPRLAVEMGFVLWWAVPALFAVAAVLHQKGFNIGTSRGAN